MTRDIAQTFNRVYGETLVVPAEEIESATAVVSGVDGQKMSKSYGNTIEMFASEKQLKKSTGRIVTDSKGVEEPKDPTGNTVYELYGLMASAAECAEMEHRFRSGGYGYGEAKAALRKKILEYFGPYRERREVLAKDSDTVFDILKDGAKKARLVAGRTLERVYEKVGLR